MSEKTPLESILDTGKLTVPKIPESVLQEQIRWMRNKMPLADPYWPKWQAPWWSILAFKDLDQLNDIPKDLIDSFVSKIQSHYINDFPLLEEDIPQGCDPYRNILCFCAAGSLYGLIQGLGQSPFQSLPLLEKLYLKFQMDDGGFNCDESNYTQAPYRSSVVSTLVMIEALGTKNADPKLRPVLTQGLDSLLKRNFIYSSKGKLIDPDWLKPAFPRFYQYDLLRCFEVLVNAIEFHQYDYDFRMDSLEMIDFESLDFHGVLDLEKKTLCQVDEKWEFKNIADLPPIFTWIYKEGIAQKVNHNRIIDLAKRIQSLA